MTVGGITSERKVQGITITGERNVQGMDITCERNVEGTDSCLQDHTDGHYITLFAEQLTIPSKCLLLDVKLLSSL